MYNIFNTLIWRNKRYIYYNYDTKINQINFNGALYQWSILQSYINKKKYSRLKKKELEYVLII